MFQGEQIIKSEDLTEADTDISSLIKFNGHAETLGKVFDVVKKSANGVDYVILGLENQSKIHYAMPLRHMIGDAFSYLKDYKELEAKNKKYKNYKTTHEFLSKFQKTDRLHPIITICIHYGEDEWDGPRSLIDMLDIPEKFQPLVSDYKFNLIELRKSELLKFQNEDVKTIFDISRFIYSELPLPCGTVVPMEVASNSRDSYPFLTKRLAVRTNQGIFTYAAIPLTGIPFGFSLWNPYTSGAERNV